MVTAIAGSVRSSTSLSNVIRFGFLASKLYKITNIGASIMRIEFWCIFYCKYNEALPKIELVVISAPARGTY